MVSGFKKKTPQNFTIYVKKYKVKNKQILKFKILPNSKNSEFSHEDPFGLQK